MARMPFRKDSFAVNFRSHFRIIKIAGFVDVIKNFSIPITSYPIKPFVLKNRKMRGSRDFLFEPIENNETVYFPLRWPKRS
jgi:hypothetical protein